MKIKVAPVAIGLIFLTVAVNSHAQTMSHEEEVVRNTYAKLSLMCGLTPRVRAGMKQLAGGQTDPQALDQRIRDATPIFNLSGFRVGLISDIDNDPWGDFVTDPHAAEGNLVLEGSLNGVYYSDNGIETDWKAAEVSWASAHVDNSEAEKVMLGLPVSEIVKLGGPQWEGKGSPVTYTRYAAFAVSVNYQGRSAGPYKAIFFFGTDAHDQEFVAINDLVSERPLWYMVNTPIDQSGLLLGKIREAPAVSDWIRDNVMEASACPPRSGPPDLCCARGRCGIAPADYNRSLGVPLPAPQGGNAVQR